MKASTAKHKPLITPHTITWYDPYRKGALCNGRPCGTHGSCGPTLPKNGSYAAYPLALGGQHLCGKNVTVSAKGKSITVPVMDTNAGASLDLSAAAFAQLAPLSQGVIRGASISVAGAPTKKASSGGKRTTSKHGGGITSIKNPKNQHASNKFAAPGVTTAGIHIPNPLPGIGAAGSFLTSLGDPHTWVRIGEVIGGAILAIFALLVIWQVFKGNDNPVSGAVSSVKSAGMKAGLVAAAA